jgi:hypothetical protein
VNYHRALNIQEYAPELLPKVVSGDIDFNDAGKTDQAP